MSPSLEDGVQNHKFYYTHADRFSPQQTVKLGTQTLDMKASNAAQWKQILPFSIKEGVIYQDSVVEVSCLIQMMKFLQRIQFTFKCTQQITDIQGKLAGNFTESLDSVISPMKTNPAGNAEIIMMLMLKETLTTSPSVKLQITTQSGVH